MLFPNPPVPADVRLLQGPAGTLPHGTLRLMRGMVRLGRLDPLILSTAHRLVAMCPEHDAGAEVRCIFDWVRDNIRYTADVAGVETLSNPRVVLERQSGDCDDQTMLLCALLESIGYVTRFVMADYDGRGFSHVYCEALVAGAWMPLDPIDRAFQFSDPHPGPHARLYFESLS